jgi:hypothetical protein
LLQKEENGSTQLAKAPNDSNLSLSKHSPKVEISPFDDGNNRSSKCIKTLPLVRKPNISKSLTLVDKWTHQA